MCPWHTVRPLHVVHNTEALELPARRRERHSYTSMCPWHTVRREHNKKTALAAFFKIHRIVINLRLCVYDLS